MVKHFGSEGTAVMAGSKKRQFFKKWEFLCTKQPKSYEAFIASHTSAEETLFIWLNKQQKHCEH